MPNSLRDWIAATLRALSRLMDSTIREGGFLVDVNVLGSSLAGHATRTLEAKPVQVEYHTGPLPESSRSLKRSRDRPGPRRRVWDCLAVRFGVFGGDDFETVYTGAGEVWSSGGRAIQFAPMVS